MSKFITWVNSETWKCNLCLAENILEEHLTQFKDKLNSGTFEFIATASYSDRAPMPPTYVFLLDVSLTSLESGYFASVLETIKDIFINNLVNNPDRSKFAFITFDTHVNFFKILHKNSTIETPQMLCISNDDIFLPAPVKYRL